MSKLPNYQWGINAFIVTVALSASPIAATSAEETEDSGLPEGIIAFASLAPRHWDLYVKDASGTESRLTTHPALDFNAAFSPDGQRIAFVSTRDGNMELYTADADGSSLQRLTNNVALDDHPAWSPDGRKLAFVSTREPAVAGRAWNAIYLMDADGTNLRRLSPADAADYSPAWSPRGGLIAFAFGSGRSGQSDIFVMKPDGSDRRLVVDNGGWPTFIDDGDAIAFHSRREEDRWDVWRVSVDGTGLRRLVKNASMPRASQDGRMLACVVHDDPEQQIAVLDVASNTLTRVMHPGNDLWNPCITADGQTVVYHRESQDMSTPNVELWGGPRKARLKLLRLAGAFPAFSPSGSRLALTGGSFDRVDVMNIDGSGRESVFQGGHRSLFGVSWSHPPERIAFSYGSVFGDAGAKVNILTVSPDGGEADHLTSDAGNNGFPSYSPDGQQLVFRSGRDGPKNLYIMDREGADVRRLTQGDWTDTMCDWSPAGEWIAFASNRDDNFEIWMIRPDGTGLKKLIGGGGRHNHPHFSPDGEWIVFTSQRAGYSAEEVSLPSQPQPYGDLFMVRTDGNDLRRLTHNGFEEGTPAWGRWIDVTLSGAGSLNEPDY